jgi:hypothetical protein
MMSDSMLVSIIKYPEIPFVEVDTVTMDVLIVLDEFFHRASAESFFLDHISPMLLLFMADETFIFQEKRMQAIHILRRICFFLNSYLPTLEIASVSDIISSDESLLLSKVLRHAIKVSLANSGANTVTAIESGKKETLYQNVDNEWYIFVDRINHFLPSFE